MVFNYLTAAKINKYFKQKNSFLAGKAIFSVFYEQKTLVDTNQQGF